MPASEFLNTSDAVTARAPSLYLAWENVSFGSTIDSEFQDIEEVMAAHEANPHRHALLVQARQELAERLPNQTRGIAALRLKQGLSQRQLAELIGTSQPHVARIEAGRDDIKLETARRLCAALHVSLDEIDAAVRARRP
jgi:DNA-binding XRE family transcriptional regulator